MNDKRIFIQNNKKIVWTSLRMMNIKLQEASR